MTRSGKVSPQPPQTMNVKKLEGGSGGRHDLRMGLGGGKGEGLRVEGRRGCKEPDQGMTVPGLRRLPTSPRPLGHPIKPAAETLGTRG